VKDAYNVSLITLGGANTTPVQKISLLTGMLKSLVGADFVVLPRFSFNNLADVAQAYADRVQLLQYAVGQGVALPVDEWLHGISLVRPKMHQLELIRMLNDNFNEQVLVGEPYQLPYKLGDTWLATVFPDGTSIDHDTISVVGYYPQGFNSAQEQCGFLVDEWTESIPNHDEVTGITFNYNQPNSAPPQALLLAMSPQETGQWTWDDLVATVLDTFARAKRRAVEPDIIDKQTGLSTLLPALLSEFSTGKNNISLDLALNIQYVREQVAVLLSTNP
jgi:hypothetical protein